MKDRSPYRSCGIIILVICLCFQFVLTLGAADTQAFDSSDANIGNADSAVVSPMAVGTMNESEENNTAFTADRTYDDRLNYGRIDYSGDEDWWFITFNQSGKANFWLGDIPSGCNYNLELYAADGTTRYAVSVNAGNIAELIQFNVTANVRYNVRIYAQSGYSAAKRYCLRIKNYPTIPSNSIGVYVTDADGQPISNAVVYVYPQKYQNTMYPYDPMYTNAYGFAYKTNLTAGDTYAINVIANNYASKAYGEYVSPSSSYVNIALPDRNTAAFNDPLDGFSAIQTWKHNSASAHVDACDKCTSFTRICPHSYMNVTIPQNFGWRYGEDSRIEFHQAVDISARTTDKVYSIFNDSATVTQRGRLSQCGNTVQLRCGELYATYMHLTSFLVALNETIIGSAAVGYAGNTDTSAVHVHLSVSTGERMWVDKSVSPNNSNVLLWNAEQIASFLDPLAYIN